MVELGRTASVSCDVSLHNNVVPKLRFKLKEMFKHTKNKETINFKASAKLLDFPSICLLERFLKNV